MTIKINEIEKALIEYADFEETESVDRAKKFITAAKRWLILRPQSSARDGASMTMSHSTVNDLLQRAHAYVKARETGANQSRVRFLAVENDFR